MCITDCCFSRVSKLSFNWYLGRLCVLNVKIEMPHILSHCGGIPMHEMRCITGIHMYCCRKQHKNDWVEDGVVCFFFKFKFLKIWKINTNLILNGENLIQMFRSRIHYYKHRWMVVYDLWKVKLYYMDAAMFKYGRIVGWTRQLPMVWWCNQGDLGCHGHPHPTNTSWTTVRI